MWRRKRRNGGERNGGERREAAKINIALKAMRDRMREGLALPMTPPSLLLSHPPSSLPTGTVWYVLIQPATSMYSDHCNCL